MGIKDRLAAREAEREALKARRGPWDFQPLGPGEDAALYRPAERGLTLSDLHKVVCDHEDHAYLAGLEEGAAKAEAQLGRARVEGRRELAQAILAELLEDNPTQDLRDDLRGIAEGTA
jgi:hypothetical protein